MRTAVYFIVWALLAGGMAACLQDDDEAGLAGIAPDEDLAGGTYLTTFDFSENAFGVQGRGLTGAQSGQFVVGNSLFRTNWVTAPASVQSLDGLGPMMNAISCGSCHFKDGRAEPPASPEEGLNGLLFRLSIPGALPDGSPTGEPTYGSQFQDKAILNVDREGGVRVTYEELPGYYADGTSYSLRRPVYTFYDLNYGELHPGFMFSPRIAPQLPGLGLLEQVPEADILAQADENDRDGDGISGRPNYVWDVADGRAVLGRFGWKANEPSLRQQAASAFNGDMGITSALFPEDGLSAAQRQLYSHVPNGGTPELTDDQLDKITLYLQALAVPARRNWEDKTVRRGKQVFTDLKCANCHKPEWRTGVAGNIGGLNGQTIRPYTDLLLHDMGAGLADGRPDFLAGGSEWRTPPLWGIGLVKTVNRHTYLLHDGRARNLAEAVLWHGGEAEKAREGFIALPRADREALIAFLESL